MSNLNYFIREATLALNKKHSTVNATLTKLRGVIWLTIFFFWGGGLPPKNLPDAHLRIQKVTSSKFFHNFVFFILQDIMNKLTYSKLKAMSLDYQVLK